MSTISRASSPGKLEMAEYSRPAIIDQIILLVIKYAFQVVVWNSWVQVGKCPPVWHGSLYVEYGSKRKWQKVGPKRKAHLWEGGCCPATLKGQRYINCFPFKSFGAHGISLLIAVTHSDSLPKSCLIFWGGFSLALFPPLSSMVQFSQLAIFNLDSSLSLPPLLYLQ